MTESPLPPTLHGTAVALNGLAVLLRGPSGAGKSDLALRLLDLGFRLVADDRVVVTEAAADSGLPTVCAPPALAGLLEVRGVGIVPVAALPGPVPLALVIDLCPAAEVPRLPEPERTTVAGCPVARLRLDPWALSAPQKVRLALSLHQGDSGADCASPGGG